MICNKLNQDLREFLYPFSFGFTSLFSGLLAYHFIVDARLFAIGNSHKQPKRYTRS